mgnify:CR=1 FL=1
MSQNVGKVVQVIGSTLDAEFQEGHLPEIYNALTIDTEVMGEKMHLVCEVQQLRESARMLTEDDPKKNGARDTVLKLAEARAARIAVGARSDRRDIALLTIDPEGSRDLDQALAILAAEQGGTRVHYAIADVAALLGAPAVVVARAALGTLNHTALTCEALRARQVTVAGVIIGAWPADPGLAERLGREDLPRYAGVPLLGALPEHAGQLEPQHFRAQAHDWIPTEDL